jgi:hypothetical protein
MRFIGKCVNPLGKVARRRNEEEHWVDANGQGAIAMAVGEWLFVRIGLAITFNNKACHSFSQG